MIRLPKATKTPLKSKLVPRQSLATIVKDLGKNTSDITSSDITSFPNRPVNQNLTGQFFPCRSKNSCVTGRCRLRSHLGASETQSVSRTPDAHQQESGEPASGGPKPAGKEGLRQRKSADVRVQGGVRVCGPAVPSLVTAASFCRFSHRFYHFLPFASQSAGWHTLLLFVLKCNTFAFTPLCRRHAGSRGTLPS